MILNDYIIETQSEIFSKDGAYLSSIASANIGSPGGAFITMEDGAIKQYDSTGAIRSEWLADGSRKIYDSSGNVVILEDPNG